MREAKAKREAKAAEGMRAWAEIEARLNAKIARIAAEASERAKIEAKVRSREREMADTAQRNTYEAGAQIRDIEEAETAKRERAEAGRRP